MKRFVVLLTLVGSLCAPFASAVPQQNLIPGTDVRLGALTNLSSVGHQGSFPGGTSAISMSTTSCNVGSVDVPWLAAMEEDHPSIAFMITRFDDSGRFIQISDRSHLKHAFFALASSQCDTCTLGPFGDGTKLGIGCSDTYSVSNNSNNFWLGPADEVDPWLGEWEATCSFFDAGLNPSPPFDCDGVRSFSPGQALGLGPLGNRILVPDAAFNSALNPQFAYQAYYVIRGEAESRRENNLSHRAVTANWNGSEFNFNNASSAAHGSVLARWPGVQLNSSANGNDDGRIYVGSTVTGPDSNGVYRYEYALHNRDNFGGIGELRLPLCASTELSGFGFKDIDLDPANNWSFAVVGNELVISTPNNPLKWNTIYNFWFDSTTGPEDGQVTLGQFFAGSGASSFAVATQVPTAEFNQTIGTGCGTTGAPTLAANSQATLGNGAFAVVSAGSPSGSAAVLFASSLPASIGLGSGCSLYLGGVFGSQISQVGAATINGSGEGTYALPVPLDPALEGVDLYLQAFVLTGAGPAFGLGDLTNGLLVRIGNDTSGCAN